MILPVCIAAILGVDDITRVYCALKVLLMCYLRPMRIVCNRVLPRCIMSEVLTMYIMCQKYYPCVLFAKVQVHLRVIYVLFID